MHNRTLLLVLFLFTSVLSYGQVQTVFKEDFENNTNEWLLVNDKEFLVALDSGKLTIQKNTNNRIMNGCLWYKKTIPNFSASKNFSISFEVKALSHEFDGWTFDFQWGKMQEQDGQRIISLYQIDFCVNKMRLGKFELSKGWKYYPWSNEVMGAESRFTVEQNKVSKYEIIQLDGFVLVKVNNNLVYKMAINPVIGSEIGFQQCLRSKWELDNLKIQQ